MDYNLPINQQMTYIFQAGKYLRITVKCRLYLIIPIYLNPQTTQNLNIFKLAEYGIYTILAAFVFGFILSFAVGANDSANSWGTPVGARTVTLGVAFLFGSICEAAGSIFLSKNVIDGISGNTSIIQMSMYHSDNATEVKLFQEEKYDVIAMMSMLY